MNKFMAEEKNKIADEIIGNQSPEMLLELNKIEEKRYSSPFNFFGLGQRKYGKVQKIIFLVGIFNIIFWLFLELIKQMQYIWISGIFLGIILIGYGISMIRKKSGEIDYSPYTLGANSLLDVIFEQKKVKGESAVLMGVLYIIIGLMLMVPFVLVGLFGKFLN
jgi:hypothetical protein